MRSRRHTFGSDMVRAGISLPALMHLMGHADIHTTMLYVRLAPEDVWREFAAPCNSAFVCPLRRRCHETFAAEHGQNPGSPDPGAHHDSPAQNCEMLSLLCPQFSRLSPHDLSPPAPTFPAPPRSPSPGLVPLPLPAVSRARQSHPSPAPAHCPPLIAGLSPPRA